MTNEECLKIEDCPHALLQQYLEQIEKNCLMLVRHFFYKKNTDRILSVKF